MSIKVLMKKRLKQLLFPAIHLYRTYHYNLYTEEERRLSNIIRNFITTTRKLTGNRKTILFYPDTPSSGSRIAQILYFLGYGATNNPKHKFDLAIKWQDTTFSPRDDVLCRLAAKNISVVNLECEDISKTYVDQVFRSVFGYSVIVDPLTYTGKCLVKSDLNAQGSGKVISCPIDTVEAGVVYNKLIDNGIGDGLVLNYRVLIFKKVIPFISLRTIPQERRFNGISGAISVRLVQPRDVFSEDEIRKILIFCQKIGLDYGELDILRDKDDKRLYIIDANNTPYSHMLHSDPLKLPPHKRFISPKERLNMLHELAESFTGMMDGELLKADRLEPELCK